MPTNSRSLASTCPVSAAPKTHTFISTSAYRGTKLLRGFEYNGTGKAHGSSMCCGKCCQERKAQFAVPPLSPSSSTKATTQNLWTMFGFDFYRDERSPDNVSPPQRIPPQVITNIWCKSENVSAVLSLDLDSAHHIICHVTCSAFFVRLFCVTFIIVTSAIFVRAVLFAAKRRARSSKMRGHSLHCIRFLTLLSAALLTAIAVVRAFNYPPSLNGGMFVQQNHASTTTTAEFKGKHARQCLLIMRSRPFGSQSSSRNVSDRYPRHPQQVMPESTPTTPSADEPISRSRAIGVGLSAWIGGLTLASGASQALDPVRKAQEMMRIWNQEEADNVLGGGELASPEGGKTLQPVLALIPIVT